MILCKQKKRFCLLTGSMFLLFLNGCSSFFSGGKTLHEDSFSALYEERITLTREKEIFEKKSLIFCGAKEFPSDLLKQLQEALEKEQIRLKILPEAEPFLLSSFLRSGKADLIAGRFTPKQIRSWHLMPLEIRTGDKDQSESEYCFAIRSSSSRLKALLEKIPFYLKEKQAKESGNDIRNKRSRSERFRKKS